MNFKEAAERLWEVSVAAVRAKCNIIHEDISNSNFVDCIVFSEIWGDEPEPADRMMFDKINNKVKIEPYY